MNRITDTVKHLIIINVLFFIVSNFIYPNMYITMPLYSFGDPNFRWYQFVSHLFMHARLDESLMHILFNMFALYSFGSNLEQIWGNQKFVFFYFFCGFGAGLTNNVVNYYMGIDAAAVGASGAIYGLLVASAFMFPEAEIFLYFIPIPLKAKYIIPAIIGLDLFSGLSGYSLFGDGIAHFAHIGGAFFGFILMIFWRNNKFNHTRWN